MVGMIDGRRLVPEMISRRWAWNKRGSRIGGAAFARSRNESMVVYIAE